MRPTPSSTAIDGLRNILNGNRKNDTVLRTVGDDYEVRAFSTFAACAIALIGTLPDTLQNRSVTVDLQRRKKHERVRPFRPDRTDCLDVLARKAARWAADHAEQIAAADPGMPPGMINRPADNWRPLLAIADEAGGKSPRRARIATGRSHDTEDEVSRLELLLTDIRTAKGNKTEMPSTDLVAALVAMEGRPWAEMGKTRKPLTQNGLARMLRRLGITPENIRVGDKVPKGYVFHHFEEAFTRYLPEEGDLNRSTATMPMKWALLALFKPLRPNPK